jgi:hypothetical protein
MESRGEIVPAHPWSSDERTGINRSIGRGQAANTGKSLYEKDHANYKIRDDFPTWFREAARQTGLKPMRIFSTI